MLKKAWLISVILCALATCLAGNPVTENDAYVRISPSDPLIKVTGRTTHTKDSIGIYWSGTNIRFRVRGHKVKIVMADEHGQNYFNLVVDGRFIKYLKLDSGRNDYTLIEDYTKDVHEVELIKRNEWDKGTTWFYGLLLENATLEQLPARAGRSIEFYGNSITAGYAVEDTTGRDSPEGPFTNNYATYASLTARHFNADLSCIVKSGIGITVSWFDLIMPELYDRLDPNDSSSRWDFRQFQPQVVVINLLQNDSWLLNMNDHPSFKKRFGSKQPDGKQITLAYQSFVKEIRDVYPDAKIICVLGCMDVSKSGSPFVKYVRDAVDGLKDPSVFTLVFPYRAQSGHPNQNDNKQMAELLIRFINEHVQW